MNLQCYSSSHVGLKRSINQDAMFMNKDQNLFFVADGLGGHLSGEVASALAISSFDEFVRENFLINKKPDELIHQAFQKANKDVLDQGQRHKDLYRMGTTLVLVWIHQGKVYIGNVGDSRAYLYREGRLWQLTDDHILFSHYLKTGFTIQKGIKNLQNNSLTRSIGFTDQLSADLFVRDVCEGDVYLLCSDGLHSMVPDQVILDIFKSEDLNNVPKVCIVKALMEGGLDNITVLVVKIGP